MIIKSYAELANLFKGANKDRVYVSEHVKAFWTYSRERNETGIGLYVKGEWIITIFPDNTFEMLITGA